VTASAARCLDSESADIVRQRNPFVGTMECDWNPRSPDYVCLRAALPQCLRASPRRHSSRTNSSACCMLLTIAQN
jgi:hypothetical protein